MWVLAWIAIIAVYLGLAAVLREIRALRDQVSRLTEAAGHLGPDQTVRLPAGVAGGSARVVLAADSTCPLCRLVLARLSKRAARLTDPPVLLTHESPQEWDQAPDGVTMVRDDVAWSRIAHLAPPVLMWVEPDGTVRDLRLPVHENDVDNALGRWTVEGVRP